MAESLMNKQDTSDSGQAPAWWDDFLSNTGNMLGAGAKADYQQFVQPVVNLADTVVYGGLQSLGKLVGGTAEGLGYTNTQSKPMPSADVSGMAAMYNGNQPVPSAQSMQNGSALLEPHINALAKVLDKNAVADAEKHVQQVGPIQAQKDLMALRDAAGVTEQATGDNTMKAGYDAAAASPTPIAPPAATADKYGVNQSEQVQANNEKIKQDAYATMNPTGLFGKIMNLTKIGRGYQAQHLANLSEALKIGGGDPESEYYKAYAATSKQVLAEGGAPISPKDRAELTSQGYAGQTKALSDAIPPLADALKTAHEGQVLASQNKGLLENIKSGGGFTDTMKQYSMAKADITTALMNVTKELAHRGYYQVGKEGATLQRPSAKPSGSILKKMLL